jgi:hypothetical protein
MVILGNGFDMQVFEIIPTTMSIRMQDGLFAPAKGLSYLLPDEAEDQLATILAPYGLNPFFFIDEINEGRPPAPWAFICLDREYPIAGHIAASRLDKKTLAFSTFRPVPDPLPDDFVPGVGVRSVGKSGHHNVVVYATCRSLSNFFS